MKIVFGTTNETKVRDIKIFVQANNIDAEILSMKDIDWDRGEIEENGTTCEENSMIKAKAIKEFLNDHNLNYCVLTDDSGLFVKALNGRPGIYTARYAEEEMEKDPSLTKKYAITKMLNEMEGKTDRSAYYKASLTFMDEKGNKTTAEGRTYGEIAHAPQGEIPKIVLYSLFEVNGLNKTFNNLTEEELNETYRCLALKDLFTKLNLISAVEKN